MAKCVVHYYLIVILVTGFFHSVKSIEGTEFELQNRDANFEAIFKYAMNTCKIKERVTDYDIEQIENNFLPTTETEKCFVACWLESFHVIRYKRFYRDQYIKLSTYGQDFDGTKKKVLRQILYSCKIQDCRLQRCELAYQIMKCVHDGAKNLGLDPKEL
ncbi:general odorant-binding protein 19d-like [Contarinia nasturtii]|uniref:general odorant-binding protein 19d-like n=1 Tax=Contarinia nasturtii TaxID=265458 RepID=UPI0012D4711F|nr:general odorant-binding protein 19d-like [Contarinia nasturtii]